MENTSFTYKVCKVVFGWWDEMELEYSVWSMDCMGMTMAKQ